MILDLISVILIIAAALLFYKYATRNFNYWEERGVPYAKPLPLIGNFLEILTFQKQIGYFLGNLYKQFKSPCFGIFIFNKPYLIIKDPELIKLIMVKDFNYFTDHITVSDESFDSLTSRFLFFLKNPEWRIIRNKIVPFFSSGKIKKMTTLINDVGEEMQTYLENNLKNESINAKEICAKYATDVIASCAFGVQAHSFQYENAEFRIIGKQIFSLNYVTSVRQAFHFLWPDLVRLLKLPILDKKVTDFMRDVFWKILGEREEGSYKRNDLIDMLIHIRNTWPKKSDIKFEGDRVVAQAGQFYLAGFEAVSSTIAFALYELCLNQNIQDKLRLEIQEGFTKHKGFTFEAVKNMKYLEMVIHETLRKYPVLAFLDRMCLKDYKIPNSNIVIEKGTPVFIPMFGLHYDPEYFPKPDEFNPERFAEGTSIYNFVYVPFGKGPRNCIGGRFGLTVVKLAITHILSKFVVEKSEDTPVPLKFHTRGIVLASTVGMPMKFRKITNNNI